MVTKESVKFSITFWIRQSRNPGWKIPESMIKFPPVVAPGGVQVQVTKFATKMKVFVLHPNLGFRKLTADVAKYIPGDTFVAVTVDGPTTKLYLNAELVSTLEGDSSASDIEMGDFVLVRLESGDFRSIKFGPGTNPLMVAEVRSVQSEKVELFFAETREIVTFSRDRIQR